MQVLDAVRRSEHTGEDRCWRCTIVNVLLTAAAATLAYTAGATFVSPFWGLAAAAAVLAVGAAAIWLRGYLVPYTPVFTRRYLPSKALSWFGKDGVGEASEVEAVLVEAGAVRPDPSGTDLEIDPEFEEVWLDEIESLDRKVDHLSVLESLGFDVEEEDVRVFEGRGEVDDSFAVEVVDRGASLARWPSRAALRTDLASVRSLSGSVECWSDEPPEWRARVVRGLRLFLPRCPDGGEVVQESDEVPSCCSRGEVVTLRCGDSGERLLEQEVRRNRF